MKSFITSTGARITADSLSTARLIACEMHLGEITHELPPAHRPHREILRRLGVWSTRRKRWLHSPTFDYHSVLEFSMKLDILSGDEVMALSSFGQPVRPTLGELRALFQGAYDGNPLL